MCKSNIQLSILIPSIPSRFGKAGILYTHLLELVGDKNIEILLLMDNKKRSIGAKREALKSLVKGKYFMFCDDDDEITSLEEIYAATFQDVDVIDFKAECSNPDGSKFIVTQRLGNKVEHNTVNGIYQDCNRPPFPNCAWNTHTTWDCHFPDVSYGEDWEFIRQCLEVAKTECYIDKVLFRYNFSPAITEASTKDNPYWKNPNHVKVIKRCVVNVSTQRYWPGQTRLIKSLYQYSPGVDVMVWGNEGEVGAEPHQNNNYAFKPRAIIKAYEAGYRQILWLDASMVAIKGLEPIFEIIERDGYFFQDSGWPNSRWTTYKGVEYFGHKDGEMLSSGVLGVDLDSNIGYAFFDKWTQAMRDGMFNGPWETWRHDQSAASLIAHTMGLKLQKANTFFVYGQPENEYIVDETVLLADGIC